MSYTVILAKQSLAILNTITLQWASAPEFTSTSKPLNSSSDKLL